MNLNFRSIAAAPFVVAMLVAIAGCTGDRPADAPTAVALAADVIIPNQGLADWVSYANQVSVVTVLSEAEIEPPQEVRDRKEGYVGRTITVRIDRTIWVAPGASTTVEGEISMTAVGWLLKGDRKIPFSGRHEVGVSYLMPIASIKGHWADAAPATPVPVDGPMIATSSASAPSWTRELAGLQLTTLAARLAETSPDPVAVQFAHLPGDQRADAVRVARGWPPVR